MRQLLFVRVLATSLCLKEIDRVAGADSVTDSDGPAIAPLTT